MEKTIILYHGGCPDGFGAAYSAWKKFGDTAEYIGLKRGKPEPKVTPGSHLYFIDFCYPQEIMDAYKAEAASLTVLDHHKGMQDVVESLPGSIFDNDHSGAVIAWKHFHPDTTVPALLEFIQDGDLYRFALPNARAVLAYVYTEPFTYESWDALSARLENPDELQKIVELGTTYRAHYSILTAQIVESADLISFEGYECYLASASGAFISDVAHTLAKKKGPLALVASVKPTYIRVSMRGDGSVDLTKIAQKYGGNGHPNASAFSIPLGVPPPWTPVESHEDPIN